MIAISLSGEEAIKIRVVKAHAKVREEKEMEVGGTWNGSGWHVGKVEAKVGLQQG